MKREGVNCEFNGAVYVNQIQSKRCKGKCHSHNIKKILDISNLRWLGKDMYFKYFLILFKQNTNLFNIKQTTNMFNLLQNTILYVQNIISFQ